jgi:hypothetical protein
MVVAKRDEVVPGGHVTAHVEEFALAGGTARQDRPGRPSCVTPNHAGRHSADG